MTKENQLLEKFQVEELEKRFEMGWINVSLTNSPSGTAVGGADAGQTVPMSQ